MEAVVEVEMVRVSVRPTVSGGVRIWVRFTAMVRGVRLPHRHRMDQNRVPNTQLNARYPVCYPGTLEPGKSLVCSLHAACITP